MRDFFVTVTRPKRPPLTFTREAENHGALQASLVKEFGEGVSFQFSVDRGPRERFVDDWEAEGRRIALEGMDLPDGAHWAMSEELGLGY